MLCNVIVVAYQSVCSHEPDGGVPARGAGLLPVALEGVDEDDTGTPAVGGYLWFPSPAEAGGLDLALLALLAPA